VTLSIAADSTPTVTVADASVDETGGLESDTQAFTTTYGSDSAGTLALSAAGATWDAATSTLAADNGDWQIVVNDDGTYTVTQLQAMTHPDASDPNDAVVVTVTADITDNEGDPAQDTFTVTFLDDGPVAADDTVTDEVDEDGSVDIDVFANDTAGADGVDLQSGVAVATAPTQGTVTYNGDGTFTYTANPGAEGSDSFSYTLTDADGDTATATVTLSIAADSTPAMISVTDTLVDEDNLEVGLADVANGDDSQVLTGTLSFDTGFDALQAIALASSTDDLTTVDGDSVSFAWDATTGTLFGYTGDTAPTEDGYDPSNTVVTVTLDAVQYATALGSTDTGSVDYTVELFQPLAHPAVDAAGEPVAAFENNLAFEVDVTLTDADGDTAPASSFTVEIDDDMPASFYPQSGHVLLAVSSDAPTEQTVTQSLNFLAGADGLGDIVFNLDLVDGRQAFLSVDGDQLYLNNEPLFLKYTNGDDQSSIQAVTESGDVGFTATIDAEGNVTYTVFSGSILTDSKITSVTDLGGIGGGNVPFKGLNIGTSNSPDPDGTDDVLVSSEILPLADGIQSTVNSTSNILGVGKGAEVSGGEVLRYDLVRNLSIDDTNNQESFSFDGYQQTNVFSQNIVVSGDAQKEASFNLRIYSMGLEDSASGESSSLVSGPGGEGQLILTAEEVKIYDENGVEQTGHVTTNSDGSVLVEALQDGWTFEIVSVDDNLDPEAFNAVEIEGVELDGGADTSFKLGEFSYGEEPTFDPVTFELPVTGSDADGDSLDSQVAITVYPDSESIVGDAQGNNLSGTSGDDSLFGLEGDDTLTGGQGDDVLAGGLGADTFAWSFADDGGDQGTAGSPAVDLVTDFNFNEVSEGDVLQLSDLLQGSDTVSDFANYLHAEDDGQGNTLLHVSTSGAFGDGFSSAESDQIIALNGVSMEGIDSNDFLESLIAEGQLNIE
ncbi:Ig-like domain-containing protein, partial [Halomonas rhizosphaerae]